jgi:hypothetical protein
MFSAIKEEAIREVGKHSIWEGPSGKRIPLSRHLEIRENLAEKF